MDNSKSELSLLAVVSIVNRIKMSCLGNDSFRFRVERDNKDKEHGRIFIQVMYDAPCTKTKEIKEWSGRKYYLSDHMTEDEIVKTAWVAFEQTVKHEVMEGFTVDNIILFNPHVNYTELLKISNNEISRSNSQS